MPGARSHTPATSTLPACSLVALDLPRDATQTPGPPGLSLELSPSPLALSLAVPPTSPNAPAAADQHHRGHRLSLVPLSSPEAPP